MLCIVWVCLCFVLFFSFCVADRFVIIPLHSLMPTVNQTQVRALLFVSCVSQTVTVRVFIPFSRSEVQSQLFSHSSQVFKRPPPGVRKIVIATNIAETRYGCVCVWAARLRLCPAFLLLLPSNTYIFQRYLLISLCQIKHNVTVHTRVVQYVPVFKKNKQTLVLGLISIYFLGWLLKLSYCLEGIRLSLWQAVC